MAITEIDNLKSNRAYRIDIYSFSNPGGSAVPFGPPYISFPAFLTDFTDSFKSIWKKEEIFGRMDPISTFKNTARTINISFDIPNDSISAAVGNLKRIDFLIKGLYPIYEEGADGASTMASPPMFRVRFSNLIRSNAYNGAAGDRVALRTGLLCYMDGFDFKPKVDSGFFVDGQNLYPKLISVTMGLNIIHEHSLGKRNGALIKYRGNFSQFPHERANPTDEQIEAAKAAKANGSKANVQQNNSKDAAESDSAKDGCLEGE